MPDSRRELIEKLSDFDDELLEKLLGDIVPDRKEVYRHLTKDFQDDLIVPVLIGAAEHEHGVRRLMKALRHESPQPSKTAERLGIPDGALVAQIYKIEHAPHIGKLSLIRVWRGTLKDGDTLGGARISNMQDGAEPRMGKAKVHTVGARNVVAISKLEAGPAGTILTESGATPPKTWVKPATPLYTVAVVAKDRKDDVKLGEALRKICEEDPSLTLSHASESSEILLQGQGDIQLQIALRRFYSRLAHG